MKKLQAIALAATVFAAFSYGRSQTIHYTPSASAPALQSNQVETGASIFQQNCAFCHGRDAAGGETGPDLTRSKLVAQDLSGNKISEVVRNGRPEKGMPPFPLSETEMTDLVAFIHARRTEATAHPGGRRGVAVADLQTGSASAGKQYFQGARGCSACHSAAGDLAGIASRYSGLQLEERMLYPKGVKKSVTVTLPYGKKVKGTLAYLDEFTVALRDPEGNYRSWPTRAVRYSVHSSVNAHVALFSKYSDDDIHNLMAYMQTLK